MLSRTTYFATTSFAILALSAGATVAVPTSTATTPALGKSPNDEIYRNLAAAGQLHWEEVNGGKGATILKEHWNAAGGKDVERFLTEPKSGLSRRGGVNGGDIQGLVTSLSCYGRGAVAQDSQIQTFATQACDYFVNSTLPKPAVKALQVWQSSDFADVNGIDGYLRYSFEILNKVAEEPSVQICTSAMDMFSALCQRQNGATQGGENTVGKNYKFNVDPTDDYNNY